MNLDLHAVNSFTMYLSVFCQVFKRPTQRPVNISCSITIEAKKARLYIVVYRLLTLAKTDAEICHTYLRHRD